MKICGIYKIENITNKKTYIGQSNNIPIRLSNHKYLLNKGTDYNSHLQRAWNKYGQENFTFEVLCECNSEEINEKEIYFIGLYYSFEYGYNGTGARSVGDHRGMRKEIPEAGGGTYGGAAVKVR